LTAAVVVTVLNLVGEGELAELVTLIEDVVRADLVAEPVGINVASEFGRVVCPEANTAHAPARTTINILFTDETQGEGVQEAPELASEGEQLTLTQPTNGPVKAVFPVPQ
jgi:hypothetical protein